MVGVMFSASTVLLFLDLALWAAIVSISGEGEPPLPLRVRDWLPPAVGGSDAGSSRGLESISWQVSWIFSNKELDGSTNSAPASSPPDSSSEDEPAPKQSQKMVCVRVYIQKLYKI
jgi:hypothetical protein